MLAFLQKLKSLTQQTTAKPIFLTEIIDFIYRHKFIYIMVNSYKSNETK